MYRTSEANSAKYATHVTDSSRELRVGRHSRDMHIKSKVFHFKKINASLRDLEERFTKKKKEYFNDIID